MRHGCFVGGASIDELLFEIFHLEEHGFGFIEDICNEEGEVFSDVVDDGFEQFSGFNWIVGSIRDWSVAGDISKDGRWVLSQRF